MVITLSKIDMQFAENTLVCGTYTAADALVTISKIELINKKDFVKAALDKMSRLL